MLQKLQAFIDKYNNIREQMMSPDVLGDNKKMMTLNKELSSLQEIYDLYQQYKKNSIQLKDAQEIIDSGDTEMLEIAQEEKQQAQEEINKLEENITIALLPKDPNDDKNIFLEIRPAAGGDEAGLFATELLRMYLGYASTKNRRVEIIEESFNEVGGLKIAVVKMSGEKVYSTMKFESGVHRVQRIPATESQGRVHTSTVTVAVMPEAEDIDLYIDPKDVEMDTMAASSAGGQNANKNQTGVRLRHIPSGIIVLIADSKSQLQNKQKARDILKAKLYQIELDKKLQEEKSLRGNQIGTGDRSEKIRTYNFPQDRVTDHRIKQSRSNIPKILSGDIQDMFDQLILENQTKLLEAQAEKTS